MATALRIFDATPTGKRLHELRLVVSNPRITVGDLIRERITDEVERYNRQASGVFNGLVQPSGAEVALNGFRLRKAKPIDAEEQCARALEAFEHNGFFLLVGDRQVDDLDEIIEVTDDLEISFVKLVPLVGG